MVQLTTGEGKDALDRMPAFFQEASDHGSDIIVFPEYVLGSRLTADHPKVKAFCGLAKKHSMYAITGMVESHGSRWSTTAMLVDREGTIIGRYLKSHPASGDPPYFWPPLDSSPSVQEAKGILGGSFKVFHLDFGQIGILQCYDGYFPEAWGCTSYMGAEMIFWINGREGMVENHYCLTAAECYGTVVGANITNGCNTGFTGPGPGIVKSLSGGTFEYGRLHPAVKQPGDGIVHAEINLLDLRRQRKHLRQMHQRRPEMYGILTGTVSMWQDYPDIPWIHPDAQQLVNKSQL